MKDFYYILGVDASCSSIEIKEAYRKLSKKFHPDLNQNDKYFEERFREIHEAYIILNDPAQRMIYDKNLKKFKSPPASVTSSPQYQQHTYKPPQNAYRSRPATAYKVNPRRSIDILFTLILIAVTIIFGDYVYNAMNAPVKSKPYTAPVAANIVNTTAVPLKHHHHKHLAKNNLVINQTKVSSASVNVPKITPVKVPPAAIVPIPTPVVTKTTEPVPNYLYKSTIHANLTGIVNMRETAKFGAPVVKEIPGDSEVFVLGKGDAYYKVRFEGVEGFVPRWAVVVK